uniref:Uncharacterized protein n=1 Tax=Trichogramma kaykai TaxID=54128 RepID=A0ABD2WZY9_9HYME
MILISQRGSSREFRAARASISPSVRAYLHVTNEKREAPMVQLVDECSRGSTSIIIVFFIHCRHAGAREQLAWPFKMSMCMRIATVFASRARNDAVTVTEQRQQQHFIIVVLRKFNVNIKNVRRRKSESKFAR